MLTLEAGGRILPKTFFEVLERQNIKNQTIFGLYTHHNKSKYSSNPKHILKSGKKLWNSTPSELSRLLLLLNLFAKFQTEKKIYNQHFKLCEAEKKIIKSIKSKTNNKPPGNDGLKAESYRQFSNELAPALLGIYDTRGKLDSMGVTYRTGIISAIRAVSITNYFRKTGGHQRSAQIRTYKITLKPVNDQ